MNLDRFLALTLERQGCVTEVCSDDQLEAMLTPSVAAALGVSESVRLRLRGSPTRGDVHVGYGSGLLPRVAELARAGRRLFQVELDFPPPKKERVEREAEALLVFANGVGRIEAITDAVLDYLVCDFRWQALSEDRQEGLLAVGIRVSGGSSPGLAMRLPGLLAERQEVRRACSATLPTELVTTTFEVAQRTAAARLSREAQAFVARMERRMLRDGRRVSDYYASLRSEAAEARARARSRPGATADKLTAIDAEERRRLQDLERRYAVQLRLEPLAVLHVRLQGLLLRARIQRRRASLSTSIGWNAIARALDRWVCDGCGAEVDVPALCEALHRLCSRCPADCPRCKRSACRACGPAADCRCAKSAASLDRS